MAYSRLQTPTMSMSEMGQSLQKRDVRTTSALPPIATTSRTRRHVAKFQDATLARTMPLRRVSSPLLWLHRGQDRHRRLKPAQDMLAERVPRARGCAGEGSGGEQ